MLRLVREHPRGAGASGWCSAATAPRGDEARASAAAFLARRRQRRGAPQVPGRPFPAQRARDQGLFRGAEGEFAPDLVLHPLRRRTCTRTTGVVSELTWNTFRDHLILEYEMPKWDGGLGSPNFFVPARAAPTPSQDRILMQMLRRARRASTGSMT